MTLQACIEATNSVQSDQEAQFAESKHAYGGWFPFILSLSLFGYKKSRRSHASMQSRHL